MPNSSYVPLCPHDTPSAKAASFLVLIASRTPSTETKMGWTQKWVDSGDGPKAMTVAPEIVEKEKEKEKEVEKGSKIVDGGKKSPELG